MDIPKTLFVGIQSIFLQVVDSTNAYALQLIAKTNPSEGTCVFTDFQTGGRGQIGRYWHSAPAQNILISYILHPKFLNIEDQFYLNMISANAVKDVVQAYCKNVTIKWPNDIYVADQKVAGILVQNVLRGSKIKASVIGIGLNVNEMDFPTEIPNPTSIRLHTNQSIELASLRIRLSERLEHYYLKLKKGDFQDIKLNYVENLYRRNVLASFISNGKKWQGIIKDLDRQGKIVIQIDNEEVAFDLREISYVI